MSRSGEIDNSEEIDEIQQPRSKTALNNKMVAKLSETKKLDPLLFEPSDIDYSTKEYDICKPGGKASDVLLNETNLRLIPFRNIAKKTRPTIKSPLDSIKRPKLLESNKFGPKKPLSDLPNVNALQVAKREIQIERDTLNFSEDPIAYFSKRKDGSGHLFIYMVYEKDKKDPYFSPYELVKVTSQEVGKDYFTMTASGVTHVMEDGETETYALDVWSRERFIYSGMRKLKFFSQYFIWKCMHNWRLFLKEQRFKKLYNESMSHTIISKTILFQTSLQMNQSQNQIIDLVKHYLLCFPVGRKFRIQDFEEQNSENTTNLKEKYLIFINENTELIAKLFEHIADPLAVQVTDKDFNFNRRHPNIQQLEDLEEQKAILRFEKTEEVNRQIASLGNFIRMVDYMTLETLARSCVDSWLAAQHNVKQDGSSIFQVEVLFDDNGGVTFQPNLEQLQNGITKSLQNSISTLNNLPRILKQPKLRVIIENSGASPSLLFRDGPIFEDFTKRENILPRIQDSILETLNKSYNDAFKFVQTFACFYPIYKRGKTWNPNDYLITREGKPYTGEISENTSDESYDQFLVDYKKQPVIDFGKAKSDIKTFIQEEYDLGNLRQGIVKGVLHIDLKTFRQALAPIPVKAKLDLIDLLTRLASMKNKQVENALSYYGKVLKMEPQTLENFVSFCEVYKRARNVKAAINDEIKFVDDTNSLFESIPNMQAITRNQLHNKYSNYENDLLVAESIRTNVIGHFTEKLKEIIRTLEKQLNKYHEKASAVPLSLSLVDTEKEVPHANKILGKVRDLEGKVNEVIKYQDIIGVELNKFAFYSNVLNVAEFALDLYTSVESWQKIYEQATKIPFVKLDMTTFHEAVVNLDHNVKRMQLLPSSSNYPILNELAMKIGDYAPFIDELEKLSSSKMQTRHWNSLLESCNQQGSFNAKMTTEELLKLNIVSQKEKITQMTNMSNGEHKLSEEFYAIANYWNKVQMPIADTGTSLNEENLLLGPTDNLLKEINDALITISEMLQRPYVSGIRDTVTSLASTLENINQIIEAWQLFQSNWVILSAIFSQDATRSLLPQQANKFTGVQRKWNTIARHTIKDPRLFSVCAFPSLLDALHENNQTMESIITSLGKLLDTKRAAMPRLYFLANNDVLQLISTTSIKDINKTVSKIMMYIKELQCLNEDGEEAPLESSKIYGIVGENNSVLKLNKSIDLSNPTEVWLQQFVDQMHETVKTKIIESIRAYPQLTFKNFIKKTNPYIAYITLNAVITGIIDDSFKWKGSKNPANALNDMIKDMIEILDQNTENRSLLIHIISHRDRYARLMKTTEDRKGLDPKLEFETMNRTVRENDNIFTQIGLSKFELGYEFWGLCPDLIYTPSIESAFQSLARNNRELKQSILLSAPMCGKRKTIISYAAECARFIYTWFPFPDNSEYFLSRILIGSCLTGSWCAFMHVSKMKHRHLCYIFDNVNNLYQLVEAGMNRITISSKIIELNPATRVFITGSADSMKAEGSLPSTLRSGFRPITIADPSTEQVASIKLLTFQYREPELLGNKLGSFIKLISETFLSFVARTSSVYAAEAIIKEASKIKNEGVEEELTLMFAAYKFYSVLGTPNERETIITILKAAFQPSYDDLLEKFEEIRNKIRKNRIIEYLKKEAEAIGKYLPITYLAERAYCLLESLLTNDCVIITGAPCTGKSTITAIVKNLLSNQEFTKEFPEAKPLEIYDCYHRSDKQKRIFGHIFDDLTFGQTWSYGQLQAILYQMQQKENYMSALRFDGKLSFEFCTFMKSFLPGTGSSELHTSSQNIIPTQNRLKVIIETPSLQGSMPSLISRCSLIIMTSFQNPTNSPTCCQLDDPSIPLNRAFKHLNKEPTSSYDLFISTFGSILPKTVKRIYHSENIILYSQEKPKMEYGNAYLFEILPYATAVLCIRLIEETNADLTNQDHINNILAIAINRIFTPFFAEKEHEKFDEWTREQLDISLPKDWIGYSVPDAFWDMFPKPCLESMHIENGELKPLDFKLLDAKPVYQARSEGRLPIFQNEVYIMNVQQLMPLEVANSLLSNKQNIILHGPPNSGKYSLLQILFNNNDLFIPIYLSASEFTSAEQYISFLLTHTPFITKILTATTMNKILVLVVTGLKGRHVKLQEFLRSITETGKINAFTTTDPKVYETLSIMKFVTVITTNEITKLDTRFLENYVPIGINPLKKSTAQFIACNTMIAYGHNEEAAKFIVKFGSSVLEQFDIPNKPLQLLQCLFLIVHAAKDDDTELAVRLFLYEFFLKFIHKFPKDEVADKIDFIAKNECVTPEERKAALDFISTDAKILLPVSHLSKDMKQFSIEVRFVEKQAFEDKVLKSIAIFNANIIEKINLRITPAFAKTCALVFSVMKAPGMNLILNGVPASGKYSVTRIIAHSCEFDFVHIAQPTPEELLVKEDRMFSLYGVIRDVISNAALHQKRTAIFVRATQYTMDEVNILISFMKNYDFTQFFSKSTLEDLYIRFTNIHSLSFEQRITAMRQIKNIIKLNVKVIISETDSKTIPDYPLNFTEIKFDHDTEEAYTELAQEAIEQSATKKLMQSTNQHVAKVIGKVAEIAKKYTGFMHPNLMYDFIDSFCHFAATDYQNIVTNNENIQSALSFVAKLEIESRTIDRRLDSLAPTLQRLQTDSESLQSSYTTRKEAIDNRQAKLKEEKKAKVTEVETLHEEVHDLEEQFKDLEPKVENLTEEVKNLDQKEIDTIRISASEPMTSMKLLFEIFCLFLELPPSYERGGEKLLMDPKFIQIITEGISPAKIQSKILDIAKPLFDDPALNPTELEATAPALLVLYNWITIVYQYSVLKIRLQSEKRILEEKEKTFKQYVEEMDVELASIDQVALSLENELKNLQASINSRQQMEKDYKAIDERKKTLDSIFKDIDQFTEKWQNDAKEFTSHKEKLIGNSIVFSFFLVFGGLIRIDGRREAYTAILDLLKSFGIDYENEDTEQMIQMRFISIRPEFYYDRNDTIHDLNMATDIHHIFATLRTPLLVDCDGVACEIVSKEIKGRMLKVSAFSSQLEVVASQAVTEGKTLLVYDVVQMVPILSSLIALDCLQQDPVMSKEVRIGGKVVNWDPGFKLILVSPENSIRKLPVDLIARTTPIDITSTTSASIKYLFKAAFAQYFHQDSYNKVLSVRKNEITKKINDAKFETDILDILADIVATQNANQNYDYLSDTETIQELIHAKEEYFKNKAVVVDTAPRDEYRNSMKQFNPFIKTCTTFWNVATRIIPKVTSKSSTISFNQYLKTITNIFTNEGFHPGTIISEQLISLRESILNISFQTFLPSMPYEVGIFFLFYISYINKISSSHTAANDLKPIFEHIRQSINAKIDYNDPYAEYDVFERLRYTSFENIFQCITQYIGETFGSDFLQNLPDIAAEKVISNNSSVPSLIITSNRNNPTYLIHHIIRQRSKIENTESISLSNDLEFLKNIKKVITMATSRGNWILVHITKLEPAITSVISDVFTTMTTTANNTNFRLVVLSSDMAAVTPSFLLKAKTIISTRFSSVKTMMQQTINNFASQIVTGKYQRLLKKLVYAVASIIAFINYRNVIHPNGFNLEVFIPLDFVLSICQRANEVFIDDEDHEPIENIRSAIMSIIYQHVTDKRDMTMISQLIKRIVREETFQDGFKVGVGPEADEGLWTMPDDSVPIPSFGAFFQKIPPFPRVETLGVDALNRSLKDWTLSKIIAEPFIKFAGLPNIPMPGFIRKIEDLIAILPKPITCNNHEFKNLYTNNIVNELKIFNSGIDTINKDLSEIMAEAKKGNLTESAKTIMMGNTPSSWKQASNVYTFADSRNLLNYLISVGKELKRIMNSFDRVFNAKFYNYLQAIISTFKITESLRTKIPACNLVMKATLCESDPASIEEGEIYLRGLTTLLLVLKGNKIVRAEKSQTSPFLPLAGIKISFQQKSDDYPTPTMIPIPLYAEARVYGEELSKIDKEMQTGSPVNHICDIYVETDDNPSYFLMNSSAIYCRVAEQYV